MGRPRGRGVGAKPSAGLTGPDKVLLYGFAALALPSLATIQARPTIRYDKFVVLIVLLAAFVGFHRPRDRRPLATWLLLSLGYLTAKGVTLFMGGHPASASDAIQAYKAYLFLPVIAIFLARRWFSGPGLASVLKLLIAVFLVKYSAVIAAGGERPVVWYENNFELMAPIGLLYVAHAHLGRNKLRWVAALLCVTILSGSRSSAVELLLVIAAIYLRNPLRDVLPKLLGVGSATFALVHLVAQRFGDAHVTGVDRLHFLDVFQAESAAWGVGNWLLGTEPLTPLSGWACSELASYDGLFSVANPDVCYSVILHSYILRGLWDQGLLGLVFLVVFLARALVHSGANRLDRWVLLGIGLINSLSVSAFNSEYFLLLMVCAVGLDRSDEQAAISPSVDLNRQVSYHHFAAGPSQS